MRAARHKPGKMRHIDHEIGAYRIGNGAETGKVPMARISGAARDNQLGFMLLREPLDRLHVDQMIVRAHAIGDGLEPFARKIDRRTMGQMSARREIEPQKDIARLQQGQEYGLIRLAAGIWLHIGEFAVEQAADTLDCQRFGNIDELAAAIIAPARIAFGIFIRHDRALRFEHGVRDDIFRGDQFDFMLLTAELQLDRLGDFRIGIGETSGEKRIGGGPASLRLKAHGQFPVTSGERPGASVPKGPVS